MDLCFQRHTIALVDGVARYFQVCARLGENQNFQHRPCDCHRWEVCGDVVEVYCHSYPWANTMVSEVVELSLLERTCIIYKIKIIQWGKWEIARTDGGGGWLNQTAMVNTNLWSGFTLTHFEFLVDDKEPELLERRPACAISCAWFEFELRLIDCIRRWQTLWDV